MPWNSPMEWETGTRVSCCCFALLCVCVCVWACSHAWWHTNRYQLWLYAPLQLRGGSIITSPLPLSLFPVSHLLLLSPSLPAPPFPSDCLTTKSPALTSEDHFHQHLNPTHKAHARLHPWTALNKLCAVKKLMEIFNSFVLQQIFLINSYTAYISVHLFLFLYLTICSNAWFVMEECVLRVDRDTRSPGRVTLYLLLTLGNQRVVHLLP